MNIIVCVKQVPGTTDVKINKETNTIIRDEADVIINPFDEYAIEEGVRIKEKVGGSVTVISMGIPKTAELLRETIAVGVDDAVLLTDKAFAGSDTLATSYALSMGIKKNRRLRSDCLREASYRRRYRPSGPKPCRKAWRAAYHKCAKN